MHNERFLNLPVSFLMILSLYVYSLCNDSASTYIDGNYIGQSQGLYTYEPYWGHIQINVEHGTFTDLNFVIRDSTLKENVDSIYGKTHFTDTDEVEQCISDGHGIEIYPKSLLLSQDLDKVDAITGATWSYNIFIATVKNALKDAKIPSAIYAKINPKILTDFLTNTFSSKRSIEYLLSKAGFIKINIYNTQGKLIKQLQEGNQQPGLHTVRWNNCPASGIYFYRLQIDNTIVNSKIFEIKR